MIENTICSLPKLILIISLVRRLSKLQDVDRLQKQINELSERDKETQKKINELSERDKETQRQINELSERDKEMQRQIDELRKPDWIIRKIIISEIFLEFLREWLTVWLKNWRFEQQPPVVASQSCCLSLCRSTSPVVSYPPPIPPGPPYDILDTDLRARVEALEKKVGEVGDKDLQTQINELKIPNIEDIIDVLIKHKKFHPALELWISGSVWYVTQDIFKLFLVNQTVYTVTTDTKVSLGITYDANSRRLTSFSLPDP